MSYTVLRITGGGVLFRAHHARRMGLAGAEALAAFDGFCAQAEEGIHVLRWDGGRLHTEQRAASRLRPGIPVRYAVSPFASRVGRFPKPPPPNAYGQVRADGVATLLTDVSGEELFESCSAAVIAWNGERWIVPPADRPGVESVAEAALREAGLASPALIPVRERLPLVLLNAVVGACTLDPAQIPLPPARELRRIEEVLRATAA